MQVVGNKLYTKSLFWHKKARHASRRNFSISKFAGSGHHTYRYLNFNFIVFFTNNNNGKNVR